MYKMVFVIRKDLKMRRGKEICQCSHFIASFINKRMSIDTNTNGDPIVVLDENDREWLFGLQKKICLQVDSEKQLFEVHNCASEQKLECGLILDAGLTEFKEPTYTCLYIFGDEDEVNKVTGKLKLY